MRWTDIQLSPSDRTLRHFAGLWLACLAALAGGQGLARGRPVAAALLLAAAVVPGVAGLLRPRLLRPLFVGCAVLTFPAGWLTSTLLLTCLYYGLFVPLGLLFRLLGRDALNLRRRLGRASYWTARPVGEHPRRYLQTF
jgi:hypothetical protein